MPTGATTREAFRDWAARQPRGRVERVDGHIVAISPERLTHIRVKTRAWRALAAAIAASGLPCEAFGDGATVAVGDGVDYQPDVVVNRGETLSGDAIAVENPIILVEVRSQSTGTINTGLKLIDSFRIPGVRHYLILRNDRPSIVHHRRTTDGIETRILADGRLMLDPPPLAVDAGEFYA